MKRLILAALAALALAPPAAAQAPATTGQAVLGVLKPRLYETSTPLECVSVGTRNFDAYLRVFDRLGIAYKLVSGTGTPVEQLRLGVFGNSVLGRADFSVDAMFFSSVTTGNNTNTQGSRVDSLTLLNKGGMEKPSLWALDNAALFCGTLAQMVDVAGSARCSTGASGKAADPKLPMAVLEADQSVRFLPGPYATGFIRNASQAPAGGLRIHLRQTMSGGEIVSYNTTANALWPDSASFLAAPAADTMLVWERMWDIATLPNAKPMVFVAHTGAGGVTDSTVTAAGAPSVQPCEGSYDVLLVAIARLDSIVYAETGKRLITKPLTTAFVVDGFMATNALGSQRGRAVADSARFYGSLDSLQAWGVPFTGGVNVDSAASYARDLILMKRLGRARWTPQVWTGMDTTAAGLGGAARLRPTDVFGHWRNRAALGDTTNSRRTVESSDSSFYQLMSYATYKLDSLGLRRSRTMIPPYLDYSPKQCVKNDPRGATRSDSILYAGSLLGYSAIVVNVNEDQSNPAKAVAALRVNGWRRTEGNIRAVGVPFRVLGSNSIMPPHASTRQWGVEYMTGMTVPSASISYLNYVYEYPPQWLHGIFFPTAFFDKDLWNYDANGMTLQDAADFFGARGTYWDGWELDPLQWPRRGSVVRVTCDQLSGRSGDPARTGLWAIKQLWNAARATNRLAGRSVWQWTYPEYVEP